jgi:predicted N-acetyltransferase YhbS
LTWRAGGPIRARFRLQDPGESHATIASLRAPSPRLSLNPSPSRAFPLGGGFVALQSQIPPMTAEPLRQPALPLQSERPEDAALVEALIDRAFGPGRFTKVSERVREFAPFRPDLSFCAWRDGRLIGVVRQYLVQIAGQPVVFLGPLAVDEDERKSGAGLALVERACQAAQAAGFAAVLLVGDLEFFRRAGFAVAPGILMPGPVDPRRVLLRGLAQDGAEGLAGPVQALLA